MRSELKEARALAKDIAARWLRTNYVAYKKTGYMHEKYDVQKCGDFGAGGEYVPQVHESACIILFPSFESLSNESLFILFSHCLLICLCLVHVFECRLVLDGQMELFWLSLKSLDGLKIKR